MNKYNSESLTLLMQLPLVSDVSRVNIMDINNYKNLVKNQFIRLPESPSFNNGDLFLNYREDKQIEIRITPRTQKEMEIIFNSNGNNFGYKELEYINFFKLGKIILNSYGEITEPDKKLYSRSVDIEGNVIYNKIVNIEFTNASYISILFNSYNDFEITMKEFIVSSFKEEILEPILQLIKDRLKEYVGIEEYEVKK